MENKNELIITKLFNASIQVVFDAWTNPEHLKNWWAPKGFSTSYCSVDLKIGGLFRYCMTSPEGKNFWGKGIYQEINIPSKITYLDTFTDPDGNPVPASYYGLKSTTIQDTKVEISFEEEGQKTKVTVRYSAMVEIGVEQEMAKQGWIDMLECLSNYLQTNSSTTQNN